MPEAPVEPACDDDRRRLLKGAATLAGLGLGGPLALLTRPAWAAPRLSRPDTPADPRLQRSS